MPRLKTAGNTQIKKKCTKGFPCGYSCQGQGRKCRKPLEGQAATYQDWLKLSSPSATDKAVSKSERSRKRTEAVVSRLEENKLAPSRVIGREEYDYPVSDDDNAKRITEYRIRPATYDDIYAFKSDGSHVIERRQGVKEYGNENLGDWQFLGMGRSPIDAMAQWVDDRRITTNDPELKTAAKVRRFLKDSEEEIKTLQNNTGEGRVWDLQPHHFHSGDPRSQIMQQAQYELDKQLSEKRLSNAKGKIGRSLLASNPSTPEDYARWESTLTPKEQKQWKQIIEIYNGINQKSAQEVQKQKAKLHELESRLKTVKTKLYSGSDNPLD